MKVRLASAMTTALVAAVFSFVHNDSEAIGQPVVYGPVAVSTPDIYYGSYMKWKLAEKEHKRVPHTPKGYAATLVNRSQFSCLKPLWGHESGWNSHDLNRSSGAYGIPQFLDSTWAGTGYHKSDDYHVQVKAGLVYIRHRYHSPCGAWSFWQRQQAEKGYGWY